MTASEFVFLAFGLVLGIGAGAVMVVVLRARPPAPREIRVTMAQDAIPRRARTLADDAFSLPAAEPARGGPADRREELAGPPIGTTDRRTPVLATGPFRLSSPDADDVGFVRPGSAVGFPIRGGDDPVMGALRATAVTHAVTAMRQAPTAAVLERDAPMSMGRGGIGDGPSGGGASASGGASGGASSGGADAGLPTSPAAPAGPCVDERRRVDERCELAGLARAQATVAEDAHRQAQRAYDDHEARSGQAAIDADPRALRRAKDDAQARFRAARAASVTTEEVEAAARAWLAEINGINGEAREAGAALAREREAAQGLLLELERLEMEAEAARIHAETAGAACLAARESLAACEEAAAAPTPGVAAPPTGPPPEGEAADDEPLAAALGSGGTPRIFRLVRGDRSAMHEIVMAMAGDDAAERRRWQLAVSDLVDAILADSIAGSSLQFPLDHPFWSPFTNAQNRDIASALSSLGYRFDGLGGWVDGRVPSQRDLSLAVGYAGIDPMRIRHWPTESEMPELYADVAVAADERLAGVAGDLTLGELVSMLGRRADGLADLWNEWGRLRPLLLAED